MPLEKIASEIVKGSAQRQKESQQRTQDVIDRWSKTEGVINPNILGDVKFPQVPSVLQPTTEGFAQLGQLQELNKKYQQEDQELASKLSIGNLSAYTPKFNPFIDPYAPKSSTFSEAELLDMSSKAEDEFRNTSGIITGGLRSIFERPSDAEGVSSQDVYRIKNGKRELTEETKLEIAKAYNDAKRSGIAKPDMSQITRDVVANKLYGKAYDVSNIEKFLNINTQGESAGGPIFKGAETGIGAVAKTGPMLAMLTAYGVKKLGDITGSETLQNIGKEGADLGVDRPWFGTTARKEYESESMIGKVGQAIGEMGPMFASMLFGNPMMASESAVAALEAKGGKMIADAALKRNFADAIKSSSQAASINAARGALYNNTGKLMNTVGKFLEKGSPYLGAYTENMVNQMPAFAPLMFDGYYKQKIQEGYDPIEATSQALKHTAVGLSIEAFVSPFVPFEGVAQRQLVKKALSGAAGRNFKDYGLRVAKDILGEGGEEFANTWADAAMDYNEKLKKYKDQVEAYKLGLTKEIPNKSATNPLKQPTFDAQKTMADAIESTIIGGITGGIFGGITNYSVVNTPMQAQALADGLKNKEGFFSRIDQMQSKGNITESEATNLKAFVNTIDPFVKAAEKKNLMGASAVQWGIEAAKANEAASILANPQAKETTDPQILIAALNMGKSATNAMKQIENGYWLKDRGVDADQMVAYAKSTTPADLFTTEQANEIASKGLFNADTIDLTDPDVITPLNEDGTRDTTITDMAEQMKNGTMQFEDKYGMPPVLDENGRVIDGKKRIALALANGVTKLDVAKAVNLEEANKKMDDAIRNGVGVAFDGSGTEGLTTGQKENVNEIANTFIGLTQEILDANVPEDVHPFNKPVFWAINELKKAGISEEQIPTIVAGMVGKNVSPALVKAFMNQNTSRFDKPAKPKTKKAATAAKQQGPALGTVAEQIRLLKEQLKQGGLSREQKKQISEQIRTLGNSEKINNFTKIIDELVNKNMAERLDKNCP